MTERSGNTTFETLWMPELISSAAERPKATCITLFEPRKNLLLDFSCSLNSFNFWFRMFSNENTYTHGYFSTASFIPFTMVSLWPLPFFFVFDSVTAFFQKNQQNHRLRFQFRSTQTHENIKVINRKWRMRVTKRAYLVYFSSILAFWSSCVLFA